MQKLKSFLLCWYISVFPAKTHSAGFIYHIAVVCISTATFKDTRLSLPQHNNDWKTDQYWGSADHGELDLNSEVNRPASGKLRSSQAFLVSEAIFSVRKKLNFWVTAAIKQQRRLTNPMNPVMVCSYRYSCIYLPVALVDFQVEGCPSFLHHVCQGGGVAMNEINLDGGERKICRDCVDKIWGREKSDTLKKVGNSTVYRT